MIELTKSEFQEVGLWEVTADHPTRLRSDKFGLQKNEADAYADSLRALGYENINVTRMDFN